MNEGQRGCIGCLALVLFLVIAPFLLLGLIANYGDKVPLPTLHQPTPR